jgi:hypothetical protein
MLKFSNTLSQKQLEEELHEFWESPDQEVFLLVFGIHESSRKKQMYINHVRIIMEQVELDHPPHDNQVKLVTLLMLFPPTNFVKACYPCIFLDGWTHYYLDSVSQETPKECKNINIRTWFRQFCLHRSSEEIDLEAFLISTLDDVIPALVSRLQVGLNSNEASIIFHKLLKHDMAMDNKVAVDNEVRTILVNRFKEYWNADIVGGYIKRSAYHTFKRDSTLNLADQIQVLVRFLFTEYLVYMIHIMSRNVGLESFLDSSAVLFPLRIKLLKSIRIPELSDFEGPRCRKIVQEEKSSKKCSNFPFFSQVFGLINRVIATCRECVMSGMREVACQNVEKEVSTRAIRDWKSIIADEIVSLHMAAN